MKKLIICLLFLFPLITNAQIGNNDHPYSTNPYQNPYDGPYTPTSNSKEKGDDNNSSNNAQKDQSKNDGINQNINSIQNQEAIRNQLKDMNSPEAQLQELYKTDPDYQRYLNSTMEFSKVDSLKAVKDSIRKDSLTNPKINLKKVYGANFFSNNNIFDLSDKSSTAPPMDYRLGPGDEIVVSLWGGAELQQNYTIAKDGSIFPKLVGKIYLQGLTLDAASNLIKSQFRKIVAANTTIDVQMGKVRTIRVTILGEVLKQGTVTISAFNTALNALFKAGGLTEIGNMRKIEIKRDGKTVDVIDLYQYLKSGKSREEVYLEDNDYIYVDVYDKLVKAEGMFKRPMYYQLTDDEGLKDLIYFSGGPSSSSRNSLIHITTIIDEEERYIDIPGKQYFDATSYDDIILNNGDVVSIKPINEGLKNVIKIEGAVNYPDDYEVKDGEKLSKIIARAGGLNPSAYMPKAFLFRGSNQLESNGIKIDLNKLEEHDVLVYPGDRIKILSEKMFEETYQIDVIGNVRKPGKIPYYKNMRLKDALLLCGGLTLDAENGRIEISNIVDSVDKYTISNKNGVNIKTVSINANLEIDEVSENITIKPLDRIYIRRKVEFLPQDKIKIIGEVSYPGEYVLTHKNEKISSIVKRAGGILPSAYAEGSKLIRKGVGPIVIDLPEALTKNNLKADLSLRDSDIIIVPTVNDIVTVKGEVQSTINIKFDKDFQDVNYYIGNAGGFGERPWKSRINVKYQNGRIKKTTNFLFIHKFPKVKAGSVVIVPKKPERQNKTKFSEVFASTMSALTSLATLILLARSLGIK
jgi:protein involved in polysaccharide export with SLBB domain